MFIIPTGDFHSIPLVIRELRRIQPESVLDIGPGFGKWGVIVREYLEVWYHKRFHRKDWKITLDAVEANREYSNRLKDLIYNNVYFTDIESFLKGDHKNYDCVLMLDVIEHLPKENGLKVLKQLQEMSDNIIIITPRRLSMTKSNWNTWEDHKCVWSKQEFEELGFQDVRELIHGPIFAVWNKPKNLN